MRHNDPTRSVFQWFEAHRAEPVPAGDDDGGLPEDTDVAGGGGDDDRDVSDDSRAQDRGQDTPSNRAFAEMRRENAKLKKQISDTEARMQTSMSESEQKATRAVLSRLKGALGESDAALEDTDPEPDRFTDPDAYRSWRNRQDQAADARAARIAEAAAARSADQTYARREQATRTARAERSFTSEHGLRWSTTANNGRGGYVQTPGARDGWTPERWDEFSEFLISGYRPRGEYSDWTEEDLRRAELAFDADAVLMRERRRTRNEDLDHLTGSRPGGRRASTGDDDRASNGMNMDEILTYMERNPQDKVDRMLEQLKPEERRMVAQAVKRVEREMLHQYENEES